MAEARLDGAPEVGIAAGGPDRRGGRPVCRRAGDALVHEFLGRRPRGTSGTGQRPPQAGQRPARRAGSRRRSPRSGPFPNLWTPGLGGLDRRLTEEAARVREVPGVEGGYYVPDRARAALPSRLAGRTRSRRRWTIRTRRPRRSRWAEPLRLRRYPGRRGLSQEVRPPGRRGHPPRTPSPSARPPSGPEAGSSPPPGR